MKDIKVKKRDGSMEGWNVDKLITSISKAGVPIDKAQEIANQVAAWAQNEVKNIGTVSSETIRDKVIEIMSEEFPTEADGYKAYKK